MPLDVLYDRMDELSLLLGKKGQDIVRRGNFVPIGPARYAPVQFVDDPDGRWEISYWYKDLTHANRMQIVGGEAMPLNTHWGIAGGDPFKFTKNKSRRFSDGGGSVFMYRGDNDRDDAVEKWEGHRFVATYRHKPPTKEDYCQDMAYMCQYYGVLMFSENNVDALNEWFLANGYRHYLKYLVNKKTGKFELNPGVYTTDVVHQKLWGLTRDHLRIHGRKECHMEYLKECADIGGVEFMGDYDLFTACGMAFLGSDEMMFEQAVSGRGEAVDISDWF